MITKRSTTSLGPLLTAALFFLAAFQPVQAIDQHANSTAFEGETLIPKMDLRVMAPLTTPSQVLVGSVSATDEQTNLKGYAVHDPKFKDVQMNDLYEREVFLLVDHSSSMLRADCPKNTVRWNWLRSQVLTLSENLETKMNGKLSLVPFAQDFKIFPNANSTLIGATLKNLQPAGATHPEKALKTICNSYFAKRNLEGSARPLLIVIVTDGVPNEPDEVIDVISQATKQMTDSREILLTFLQIADDHQGNSIMDELDKELVDKQDVRFDIINRRDSHQVQRDGLERSLKDSFAEAMKDDAYLVSLKQK